MAEINQGIKYTIEADASKAQNTLKSVGKESMQGFNPLSALTAALSGNFSAMGQELAKLVPRFKSMGAAATAAFGAVGAAVLGVVKFVQALHKLLKTVFNTGGLTGELKKANSALFDLRQNSIAFRDSMAEARDRASAMSKRLADCAAAINAMTKAQNEYNRAQELALAKTEKERAAVNRRYDRANAAADEGLATDAAQRRVDELNAERKRLKAEIAESLAALNAGTEAGNRASDEADRQEELGKKLAELDAALDVAKIELKTAQTNAKKRSEDVRREDRAVSGEETLSTYRRFVASGETDFERFRANEKESEEKAREADEREYRKYVRATGRDENADIDEADFQRWKAYRDEEAKIEAENAAELKRQAEEDAKEIERVRLEAEKAVHDRRMADLASEGAAAKTDLDAARSDQSAADARLAAAQSAVQRAWGWYRDKDSMKAQMEEEKANAEAERQYEKDFAKLSFRRDWRTAKNLSVDEEATRRVAIAKEEEAAAQKAALETAENTARAADAVEKIRQALEEE